MSTLLQPYASLRVSLCILLYSTHMEAKEQLCAVEGREDYQTLKKNPTLSYPGI
jgi:hypothetical protein